MDAASARAPFATDAASQLSTSILSTVRATASAEIAPYSIRSTRIAAGAALAMLFLAHLGMLTFVDPDMWHEMALAREIAARRAMPLVDDFAYTPTVTPVVHHEWGTGMVLYAVARWAGGPGIMALKYLLTLGTVWLACRSARRHGASWETIFALAPAMILAGVIGFTTIRAQLFTLFFLAWLMNTLADEMQVDEAGPASSRRSTCGRALWLWIPLFVVWLNLHAGFVVGAGILAVHAGECVVRRRRVAHLVAAGAAAAALVACNPYGIEYYGYLAHGLTMPRPLVTEWQPLWTAEPTMFRIYLVSVLLVLYAAANLGLRQLPGIAVLAVTAYLAARHTRHVSLYFVVWMSLVPGYIERTGLGATLVEVWHRRSKLVIAAASLIFGYSLVQTVYARPWQLIVPTSTIDERLGRPVYPVGAVEYLRKLDFHGNLFTPFVPGGYCLYQLHPAVKVSLDGRYEVAYQPGMLEENVDFYAAKPGWDAVLTKYPTDLVLTQRSAPVAERLASETDWHRVYVDEAYAVFARPGLQLPTCEHAEAPRATQFP